MHKNEVELELPTIAPVRLGVITIEDPCGKYGCQFDGPEDLFSYEGEFQITDIIVANSQYEVSVEMPIAASFTLSDAYPNPFNPTTAMTLTMPASGEITVEVYNVLGQVVATLASGYMEANTYTLTWDASNASSGVYFVQADTEGFTKTQKLMLVK